MRISSIQSPGLMKSLLQSRFSSGISKEQQHWFSYRLSRDKQAENLFENAVLENSSKISAQGLWLPSHMGVSDRHIEIISEKIKEFSTLKT